jgi:hypothetical protein
MGVEMKEIVGGYFREHPESRDEVMRAYYAYHAGHFRESAGGHNFTNGSKQSRCVWCGRTRELVRWDDLPPECGSRPDLKEVDEVVLGEEGRFFALLKKAERDVPGLVAKHGMSGETLALLHGTHGYDPETVAGIVDVPAGVIAEYERCREEEANVGKRSLVRETVMALV